MARLLLEIVARPAESSRGRHSPRGGKRKMSNFPTKARAAAAASARLAMPQASPKPASRRRRQAAPDRGRRLLWLEHITARRAGNLPRAAYCRHHQREPRAFTAWIARLRHRFRRQPNHPPKP